MVNSKKKGAAGELEFSNLCKANGYRTRRTAQYCGNTEDASDVVGLPGIHIECKRVENLNLKAAYEQAKRDSETSQNMPIVAHRKNRQEWMITMSANDWFKLYKAWEKGGGTNA